MVTLRTVLFTLASVVAVSADYVIDPTTVDLLTRRAWCNDELSNCPIICQQKAPGPILSNTCDPETLTYGCICSDGLQPNMSEYSLTIPFHVCQQWGTQCVAGCGPDNACSSRCREDHPCGAQNPTKVNVTSSTKPATTTGAAATGPAVFNGMGDGAAGSAGNASGSGASALEFGRVYGFGLVAASLFAGFALGL